MNIGVDFGSTYTTVSEYDELMGKVHALLLENGSPYIPSVAARNIKNGKYKYGGTGKTQTGKPNFKIYTGFKMLLPETDKGKLKTRGFDEVNTPYQVTEGFLEHYLRETLSSLNEKRIDHLVVCVPEIWSGRVNTLDGRTMLRDICQSFDFVDAQGIQVVSEPEAASAFFAYNYKTLKKRNYDGYILMIDYGGGTLDITLTDVSTKGGSGEQGMMEIKTIDRTGAGEHHEEKKVGQAGIVYMETVVEEAIRQSGLFGKGPIEYDGEFHRAVNEFEAAVRADTQQIRETFQMYGVKPGKMDDIDLQDMDDDEGPFTTVVYRKEDVEVPYSLLVKVYDQVIYGVLNTHLEKIKASMKECLEAHRKGKKEFKIALVGGFSRFCLVEEQVRTAMGVSELDEVFEGIIDLNRTEERQEAVSLGAALLAGGVLTIRNTAHYSLGVFMYDAENRPHSYYGIEYRQELKPEKVYFPTYQDGGKVPVVISDNRVLEFIINESNDNETAMIMPVQDKFKEQLRGKNLYKKTTGSGWSEGYRVLYIGFSVDSSGIISLHVQRYNEEESNDNTIELTRYGDLFKVSELRRFIDA